MLSPLLKICSPFPRSSGSSESVIEIRARARGDFYFTLGALLSRFSLAPLRHADVARVVDRSRYRESLSATMTKVSRTRELFLRETDDSQDRNIGMMHAVHSHPQTAMDFAALRLATRLRSRWQIDEKPCTNESISSPIKLHHFARF